MSGDHPNFEEVVDLIRQCQGFGQDKRIEPEMQFERDLGVTGDDGSELLELVERQFGIEFTDESFGLDPNEYLFHSEGFDLSPAFVSLFGTPTPKVRCLTVGELFEAVKREIEAKSRPKTRAPQ